MELPNAARIQFAAQFRRQRCRDQLPRGGTIVQPVEQPRHPGGHVGAAHRRHLLDRGKAHHRHDPRHDFGIDPGRRRRIAEPQERIGFEKELGDRAIGPGVDLALQIVQIVLGIGRIGMTFGIGRDRNLERVQLAQARDQRGGIFIPADRRLELRPRRRRIAAQRDDMPHACRPIFLRDRVNLLARRLDTGQVRGGGDRRVAGDAGDGVVRPLARRAARAIGDADEPRRQRRERLDRLPQGRFHLLRLGREEFEADVDIARHVRKQRRRCRVHAVVHAAFTSPAGSCSEG